MILSIILMVIGLLMITAPWLIEKFLWMLVQLHAGNEVTTWGLLILFVLFISLNGLNKKVVRISKVVAAIICCLVSTTMLFANALANLYDTLLVEIEKNAEMLNSIAKLGGFIAIVGLSIFCGFVVGSKKTGSNRKNNNP